MKKYHITLPDRNTVITTEEGITLLSALTAAGLGVSAPCGGYGTCGKCKVLVDGVEQLSCQTIVDRDMKVALPEAEKATVLTDGIDTEIPMNPLKEGYLLAVDIGTTTVACYLLDGVTGQKLANASMLNSQAPFGADVVSRIQAARKGKMQPLTDCIRECLTELTWNVCREANIHPEQIGVVSIVGNPAMQQLFMGIPTDNLATVPFDPVLTESKTLPAKDYLPVCENAVLLVVPDISGYVGADTMGCILATRQYEAEEMTLMVDIGTNGEMVLGNKDRLVACSTAAGPALEGANIHFGMRGAPGAIDHVWLENGEIQCSVIGGGKAKGICGSGLIDAMAVLLDAGIIDLRGRILTPEETDGQKVVYMTPEIYLTQEDIREVQLAKGAIAAGIELMAQQIGVTLDDIQKVLLAGAFGTFMDAENACRIGLLPRALSGKSTAIGNAAGSGAKLMACNKEEFARTQELIKRIEFLELASLPKFQRTFARNMRFEDVR